MWKFAAIPLAISGSALATPAFAGEELFVCYVERVISAQRGPDGPSLKSDNRGQLLVIGFPEGAYNQPESAEILSSARVFDPNNVLKGLPLKTAARTEKNARGLIFKRDQGEFAALVIDEMEDDSASPNPDLIKRPVMISFAGTRVDEARASGITGEAYFKQFVLAGACSQNAQGKTSLTFEKASKFAPILERK